MYQALYMVYGYIYIYYIYSIYVAQFTQAALPGSLGTSHILTPKSAKSL